ncbi:MAG: hypothetical protein AMXMBFR23_01350 [Chloroflexota bacterium]
MAAYRSLTGKPAGVTPGRALGGGVCVTARAGVAGSPGFAHSPVRCLMVLAHRSPAELDAFLVRRAQAGDRDAFATLMEEYGEVVSRLVRHFVQDGDDARDVEQDTWIRAATHLDSLRDESRFRPWVKSIARSTSLNFLSSRKRRRERVSTFDECGTEDFEDQDAPTPERALMSQESQRKVWLVLGALSERDRTALYLREYQDQPYEAIGERLGISRNAAEVCVFRARERFRKLFAQVESFVPTCGVDGLRLSMLLDGEASSGRADLERHVAGCDCCRERLQTMAAGRALYRNLGVMGFPLLPSAGLLGWLGAVAAKIAALFGGGSEAAAAGGGAATAAGAGTGAAATGTAVTATAASASGAAAVAGTGFAVGSVGFVATATAAVAVTVGAVVAPVAHAQTRAASPVPVAAAVVAPQVVDGSAPASPQLVSGATAPTVVLTGKPATPEVAAGDPAPAPPSLAPVEAAPTDPVVPAVLVAAIPASTPAPVTSSTAAAGPTPVPAEAAAVVAVSQEPASPSSAPAVASGDPQPSGSGSAATTQESSAPKGDHRGGKPDHAGKAKSDEKGGKPEASAKPDEKGAKSEAAAKSDDKGGKPEAAGKSDEKGGKPEAAAKSDEKGGKPEVGPKSDDKGGKPEAGPKSEDKGGKGKGKNA